MCFLGEKTSSAVSGSDGSRTQVQPAEPSRLPPARARYCTPRPQGALVRWCGVPNHPVDVPVYASDAVILLTQGSVSYRPRAVLFDTTASLGGGARTCMQAPQRFVHPPERVTACFSQGYACT